MEKKQEIKGENLIKKILEWRNRLNQKLKQRLDSLSSTTRINTILIMLLLYALITLIISINAFSGNNRIVKIKHIESVSLIDNTSTQVHSNNTVNKE